MQIKAHSEKYFFTAKNPTPGLNDPSPGPSPKREGSYIVEIEPFAS